MTRCFQFLIITAFCTLLSCSCIFKRPSEGSGKTGRHISNTVVAAAETDPVPQNRNADSADDAAIWIHPTNAEKSFVIGTDKKGGMGTYTLEGELLHYYKHGAMNNTDLRYGFPLGDQKIDLLASSNLTSHAVSLHKISEGGVLEEIHARTIKSKMRGNVYGLCMYKSAETHDYYVFLNSMAGEIEQWQLFENAGKVDAKLVRSFHIKSKTEGMVADDEHAIIYIAEEVAGIHKLHAEPNTTSESKIVAFSTEKNKNLRFDIEGLAIYDTGGGEGYLLASSQGNYSYAVYERQGANKYLGSFRIVDGTIDGVEETDGIAVTNKALGENFPKGLFVAQDGYNYDGKKLLSQNFKYVSWELIEKLIN